jgi:hypothetical protein
MASVPVSTQMTFADLALGVATTRCGLICLRNMESYRSMLWLEAVISFIVTGTCLGLSVNKYFIFYYYYRVTREPELQEWVVKMKPEERKKHPLTDEISFAIDRFYFNHYCQAFRSGAFARANSSM